MSRPRAVKIGGVTIGGGAPLALIGGPCAIEDEKHALMVAERLLRITEAAGVPFVYKSSYDKANRSSAHSYRGPGLKEGLRILRRVKDVLGLPVLSDVHDVAEVGPAAEALDVLQVPAFLCRQTDLVVDFRSLPIMRAFGYPVVFDATHSVQLPGGQGARSGGERQYVQALARAAVAVGVDALFMEIHEDPDRTLADGRPLSDGPNMLKLDDLPPLLDAVLGIRRAPGVADGP